MQEINYAGQESSAWSSRQARCRVCDGPVEWPQIVCNECDRREEELMEWEFRLKSYEGED